MARPRRFLLPWPPSVNHIWRRNGGRYFVSGKGKQFYAAVAQLVGSSKPMKGRLCVQVVLFPPDRRARDIDNLLKPILDSLQKAGVIEDDSQVDILSVVRMSPTRHFADNSKGCCQVTVSGAESALAAAGSA